MRQKFDPFTWVVVAVVALLVVGAIVTVSVSGKQSQSVAYLSGDSPSAPVYNAILAAQRGEISVARQQFSQSVLDGYAKQGYDPISNAVASYANDENARRIRIVKVENVTPEGFAMPVAAIPELAVTETLTATAEMSQTVALSLTEAISLTEGISQTEGISLTDMISVTALVPISSASFASTQAVDQQAFVTIAEDYFYSGGLLGRNSYSNQRIIMVVNENGVWKIADTNLFY